MLRSFSTKAEMRNLLIMFLLLTKGTFTAVGSVDLDDKQQQSLCRLLARRGAALGHLAR